MHPSYWRSDQHPAVFSQAHTMRDKPAGCCGLALLCLALLRMFTNFAPWRFSVRLWLRFPVVSHVSLSLSVSLPPAEGSGFQPDPALMDFGQSSPEDEDLYSTRSWDGPASAAEQKRRTSTDSPSDVSILIVFFFLCCFFFSLPTFPQNTSE